MEIWTQADVDQVRSRNKTYGHDPITFEFLGRTGEELTWIKVDADGPDADMFRIARWLTDHNITEWCWTDRAADRMVHRNSLFFKHEKDAILFRLWWIGQ